MESIVVAGFLKKRKLPPSATATITMTASAMRSFDLDSGNLSFSVVLAGGCAGRAVVGQCRD